MLTWLRCGMLLALAGACASTSPAAAQAADDLPDTSSAVNPGMQAPSSDLMESGVLGSTSDFIMAGWGSPTEWRFSMGPLRPPGLETLRLTRRVPGGGIAVSCSKALGQIEMMFLVDGHIGVPGNTVSGILSIANSGGPVNLREMAAGEGERDTPMALENPVAVTDILYAIAAAEPGSAMVLRLDGSNSSLTTTSSMDRQLSKVTARVCDGWRRIAMHDEQPPSPMTGEEPQQ